MAGQAQYPFVSGSKIYNRLLGLSYFLFDLFVSIPFHQSRYAKCDISFCNWPYRSILLFGYRPRTRYSIYCKLEERKAWPHTLVFDRNHTSISNFIYPVLHAWPLVKNGLRACFQRSYKMKINRHCSYSIRHMSSKVILIAVVIYIVFPSHTFSQDFDLDVQKLDLTKYEMYEKYRIHDIKAASKGKGLELAFKWAYAQNSLKELIPLYGYKVNHQGSNEASTQVCENIDEKRKLDFFTALSAGKSEWTPAQYKVGYAGVALEQYKASSLQLKGSSATNTPNESSKNAIIHPFIAYSFNNWKSKDIQSSEDITLGLVCKNLKEKFGSMQKHLSSYLVTQNPIPDIKPDRLLWTDLNNDKIEENLK